MSVKFDTATQREYRSFMQAAAKIRLTNAIRGTNPTIANDLREAGQK